MSNTKHLDLIPTVAVGAVVIHKHRLLLVKRAKAPNAGFWCIPGGKIHFGETLQQAAEREIKEETGLVIEAGDPYYVFDLLIPEKKTHFVIVDLMAKYISGEIIASDDAEDAHWFSLNDIAVSTDIEAQTLKLIKKLRNDNKLGA